MQSIKCQGEAPYDWTPVEVVEPPDYTDEQLGTKEKFWFRAEDDRMWLFKYARHRRENGADWAEALVHVVAQSLGLPSACISLAVCGGARGVLVRSVLDDGEELAHGNELLARSFPDYDRATSRNNPLYTVANIKTALRGVASSASSGLDSGFDQLVGYLLLDALVAGRDRHHENWAVVVSGSGEWGIAPSFDHGNALAFAEPPDRAERLASNEQALRNWVRRGTSHHFAGRPTLVDVALVGLELCGEAARSRLLGSVESLELDQFQLAISHMPREIMSDPHRRLVGQIIEQNRRRLFDGVTARVSI